jgi:DegV family protein with EDD domain
VKNYVLLTESGSDLSSETAKEYGITIVPMYLQLNGKTYADGNISPAELFDYCDKNDVFPTTSAPSPGEFRSMYHKIRNEAPDSIIIHIGYSAQTTCSYQNSIIADEGLKNIYHVDTEQVSAGLGAVAIQTARYLRACPDVEPLGLIDKIKEFGKRMNFYFVVPDMRYLKSGGRCSNAQYLMAQILSIKPLIEMKNGLLVGTRKFRGKMERACEKMVDSLFSLTDINTDEIYLGYTHGISKEICARIEAKCRREHNVKRILWFTAGCIISTHGGPGVLAIGALSKG